MIMRILKPLTARRPLLPMQATKAKHVLSFGGGAVVKAECQAMTGLSLDVVVKLVLARRWKLDKEKKVILETCPVEVADWPIVSEVPPGYLPSAI